MTSHDGAHAETPRAPAHEEESGTISCPKRFAPRATWPVQKRLGAHAETPGKSTIYNWPAPPSTIKEAPKLLSQRQEDGEGKEPAGSGATQQPHLRATSRTLPPRRRPTISESMERSV